MQEKATREISGIRKEKDDAGHRLVAECDRLSDSLRKAKDKKSQCKKAGIQIPGKLRRVLKQVEGLQAELGEAQDTLTPDPLNAIDYVALYPIGTLLWTRCVPSCQI